MNDEVKAVEQQDDLSIDTNIDDLDGGDLLSGGEGSEEVEIVLAGQDGSPSSEAKPDHRDHILRRLQKKKRSYFIPMPLIQSELCLLMFRKWELIL
jgi:hypothetical protein